MSVPDTCARAGKGYDLEFVQLGAGYPSLYVDDPAYARRVEFELTADAQRSLAGATRMEFRRWCGEGETTWTMARSAVRACLAGSPSLRDEIDIVLACSGTSIATLHPSNTEHPGMADIAPLILNELGRNGSLGFDLKACYCTGFIRCIETADALLANPNYRSALIVATEQGSRFATAASNRSSFVYLSADGAGAALVRKCAREDKRRGVVDYLNVLHGDLFDLAGIGPDGVSMVMKGSRAGSALLDLLALVGLRLLRRNGLGLEDIDWVIPIQGHAGLIDELRHRLGCPPEKILWSGGKGGFCGSASIPMCLAERTKDGTVRRGDYVLLLAAGAGMSAGGSLVVV